LKFGSQFHQTISYYIVSGSQSLSNASASDDGLITLIGANICSAVANVCGSGGLRTETIAGLCHTNLSFVNLCSAGNIAMAEVTDINHPLWSRILSFFSPETACDKLTGGCPQVCCPFMIGQVITAEHEPIQGAIISTSVDSETAVSSGDGYFFLQTVTPSAQSCKLSEGICSYTLTITANGYKAFSSRQNWGFCPGYGPSPQCDQKFTLFPIKLP
jgi:hypothetical protein